MKKVYCEYWFAMLFLVLAVVSYGFDNDLDNTRWFVVLSVICLGVNSIKQFIIENKGEVK